MQNARRESGGNVSHCLTIIAGIWQILGMSYGLCWVPGTCMDQAVFSAYKGFPDSEDWGEPSKHRR